MNDDNVPLGHTDWLREDGLRVDDVVSCDAKSCKNPASYYSKLNCCGAVCIHCEPCMARLYQLLNFMVRMGEPGLCHECGKRSDPVGWVTRPQLLVDTSG